MRSARPAHETKPIRNRKTVSTSCRVVVIPLLAFFLCSCSLLFRKPEPGIQIREEASVCFRSSNDAHILASVQPSDCYSMRCTRVNQAIGTAVLDQGNLRLDLETSFNLSPTKPFLGGCTPDCIGGGRIEFDLGILEPGLYSVNLWGHEIGELSVTSGLPWQNQCFPK